MFKPVEFRPEVEEIVRFVEETDPHRIIEETVKKLQGGLTPQALLTANSLAKKRQK